MQYSTLEQILIYVIENKLSLTPSERKFLLNLKETNSINIVDKESKIEIEDFLKWYNSPIRKDEITNFIITQTLSRNDLENLIKISPQEIEKIIKRYERFKKVDIGYLILSYTKLRQAEKKNSISAKDNNNKISKNCIEILDILSQDLQNCKSYKLDELIQHKELYHRKDLIEKLIQCKNEREINVVRRILESELSDIDIAQKYIELELENKNERCTISYDINHLVDKVRNKKRAKEAILRQNSIAKMNQVIYASANNGIYKNSKIFNLIQSQSDPKAMENIRSLAKINRLRKYSAFFEWYEALSPEKQEFLVDRIYEKQDYLRKIQQRKQKTLEENFKKQITVFAKSNSDLSVKKLIKTLKTNISEYPSLGNKDTSEN